MLELSLIEVDRPKLLYFWKTENVLHVVASVDRNQKGTKESVQHEKCSILCVDYPSGILEPLDKWKIKFMLKNYKLV